MAGTGGMSWRIGREIVQCHPGFRRQDSFRLATDSGGAGGHRSYGRRR